MLDYYGRTRYLSLVEVGQLVVLLSSMPERMLAKCQRLKRYSEDD